MERNDVVITGVGMVTPLGTTAPETARAWREGRSAPRRSLEELAGTPLEHVKVAALPELQAAERLGGRRMLKYMSEAAVLGSLAAREALEEAKVRNRFSPERLGLYSGIGLAAANFGEVQRMIEESVDANGSFSCHLFGKRGLAATKPLMSFKILANIPACLISIMEQIKGPNLILTPWEGQTGAALLEAWRAVTSGEVDCALAGAADSAAYPAALVYLQKTGLLREGEYPASSAAYFVLERFETAETDRKRFYAHVESIEITNSGKETSDPLSARMGRTFAAAPALLLGIGCMDGWRKLSICGVDRQRIEMNLKVSL